MYVLAESQKGYTLNFICHPHGVHTDKKKNKMAAITMLVSDPKLDLFHHIFTDRLYTLVEVARQLLARNTYLTGAEKTNSKGLPRELLTSSTKNPQHHKKIQKMSTGPRGTFYIRQNGQLTCTVWKDSKVMMPLSSAHQLHRSSHTMVRKVKDDGMARREEKVIKAPPHAVDYTKHMGGVAREDQLRANYSCSKKSQKWWLKSVLPNRCCAGKCLHLLQAPLQGRWWRWYGCGGIFILYIWIYTLLRPFLFVLTHQQFHTFISCMIGRIPVIASLFQTWKRNVSA